MPLPKFIWAQNGVVDTSTRLGNCRHTREGGIKGKCNKLAVSRWLVWVRNTQRYVGLTVCEEHNRLLHETNGPLPEEWRQR